MLDQQSADPGRFSLHIDMMREMGWSWQDLMDAPAPLVDELAWRLQAKNHWTAVRARQDRVKAESLGKSKHPHIR